ncbi:CAP domain-containing protein [Streptomyces sp. NPDC005931]|uniref:CAP domain-containing protein n=1 Tax=Streptomyces sp. NPDC005931 TaxID=3364737 RepID=UPI0036A3D44C
MAKHRHQQRYRRTVVTTVALSVIGIPSVALACSDWPTDERRHDAATTVAAEDRWDDHNWYREWSRGQDLESAASPSKTAPTASASKRGEGAKPSRKRRTTAPKAPQASASKTATIAPKATTAGPEPTTTPTTSAPRPTATATATASGAVARVVELVNAERSKAGCSPVTVNSALTRAAQAHSDDMASSGTMSHTGSDGSSPADRITRAGYSWSTYGENVAYGYSTPEQVMQGWMNSSGHRANILNCGFREIGVALAQPGSYWTQAFGTAR